MARAKDEWHWNHTSSLICWLVNLNTTSKDFKPPDRFHPYRQKRRAQSNESVRENLNSLVGVRRKDGLLK